MLHILTYNLGGAKHLRAERFDYDALAADAATAITRALDPAMPTVIALQEVGWGEGPARRYDCAASIAAHLGPDYRAAFGAELTRADQPHAGLWGRAQFAGLSAAAEGNAIVTNLSPAPWPWPTVDALPAGDEPRYTPAWARNVPIGRPTLYSTASRDTQPRAALIASLRWGDLPLFFINTHLTTLRGEDRHQAEAARSGQASRLRAAEVGGLTALTQELLDAETAAGNLPARPILLAGDFNARPNTVEMRLLAGRYRWLNPEADPGECWSHITHRVLIDHIFIAAPDERLAAARCVVVTDLPYADLSDHRPVLAALETTA
jgi:endonuclease/exonuclease/phosphatase family metal-dependent hydrolase